MGRGRTKKRSWVPKPALSCSGLYRLPHLLAVISDAQRDLLPCTPIRQIISHLFPADFLKPTPAAPTLHTPLVTTPEYLSNQSLCFALTLPASRLSGVWHVGKIPQANEASERSAHARLSHDKPSALPKRQVHFLNQITCFLKPRNGNSSKLTPADVRGVLLAWISF